MPWYEAGLGYWAAMMCAGVHRSLIAALDRDAIGIGSPCFTNCSVTVESGCTKLTCAHNLCLAYLSLWSVSSIGRQSRVGSRGKKL